jgi:DNA-binding IscR family transcriptional regulator
LDTCPVSGALRAIDQRVRDLLRTISLSEVFQTTCQPSGETTHRIQLALLSKV